MPRTRYPEDLDFLLPIAEAQEGFVSAVQAAEEGIGHPDLARLTTSGHLERALVGVYRLARWPIAPHGNLWALLLWATSKRWPAVLSHRTALALHGGSDINPSRVDLTVPRHVRFRGAKPKSLVIHRRGIAHIDTIRIEGLPCTTLYRTLLDLMVDRVAVDTVEHVLDGKRPKELSESEFERLRAVNRLEDKELLFLSENFTGMPVRGRE